MLNSILVPLDGSPLAEGVLSHVLAIAQAFKSQVTLLRVLELPHMAERQQAIDPLAWQINKTEANLYLDTLVSRLQALDVSAQKLILEGPPAERIIEYAQIHETNLIALSNHGRSGINPWGLSSVTQKIIYSTPTSLMVVRANDPPPEAASEPTVLKYQRLLIPLDGSWRAEGVLPIVVSLAHCYKSQVHLVHVVPRPEMARRTPLTPEETDLLNQVTDLNREEAARYLEQVRARLAAEDVDCQYHLLVADSVTDSLYDLVEQEGIDLVIQNAHGYTGNTRWPYGGLAHHFMFYGKVPLLTVQDFPNKVQPTQAEEVMKEHPGQS